MSTLNIPLPESVRERAERLAAEEGVPLEQFVSAVLIERVALADADTYLRHRAAQGSREEFLRILAKVPDVEPEDYDRLSPGNAGG